MEKVDSKVWFCEVIETRAKLSDLNETLKDGNWDIVDKQIYEDLFVVFLRKYSRASQTEAMNGAK